jgi:hypothetical protein
MRKYLRFYSVVTKNEFKAIRGSGFQTIIYLSCILYLTFLCIGFSNKALLFQNKLAKSPLSNWVNIAINKGTSDSTISLISNLSDTLLRNRYLIENLYQSKEFGTSFLDRTGTCSGLPLPKARTIDAKSSVIHDLFNSNNVVRAAVSDSIFLIEPFGFVVTDTFLKKLGFHCDSVSWLSYRLYGGKFVPVPILGVVKELPDHADVVCTDSFYVMQMNNYPDDSRFTKLFIETRNPVTIGAIKNLIRKNIGVANDFPLYDSLKGYRHSLCVFCLPKNLPGTRKLFSDNLRTLYTMKEFRGLNFGTYYEVKQEPPPDQVNGIQETNKHDLNFDYLAIEFRRLDSIKNFAGYIKDRYNISLNMETLKQRQNYLFSLNVSLGAIILVLVLSVLTIVIFISNTLKNHLDRVKRNLGNFLAFGTSGNKIVGIYISVVLEILLASSSIAIVLAWFSGELFDRYLLKHLLILEGNQDYFSLFNAWLVLFLIIVFSVAMLKTIITVRLLVRQSPGDLIYERVNRRI